MLIALYTSGHGYGHASRDVELMRAIRRIANGARFVVRTSAPAWLFAGIEGVDVQHKEVDPGMAQIDSLRIDEAETARRVAAFHANFDRRVSEEASLLQRLRPSVVVGDVPPLAFAAAARAGIRSVAVANFTWDWIYGIYPAIDRQSPQAIPTMREAYASATLALRLPLHGGFEPMRAATHDIPFIARRSTRDRRDLRRLLGITDARPVVLASFGGYGISLPYEALAREMPFTVINPDAIDLRAVGVRYQDLVAAADVVVSKPGYGIVSECIANDAALLYTSRGRFAEYDVFVREMPAVLRCRPLSQQDLLAGRWSDAVEAVLSQPTVERPRIDGADVAAQLIVSSP
jgi:hypothetical protein